MKLKIEIMYYKLLGYVICWCPVPIWKDRLLSYAERRFPVD